MQKKKIRSLRRTRGWAPRHPRKLCQSKGATVCGSGVVNWAKFRRDKTTAKAVDRLSGLF